MLVGKGSSEQQRGSWKQLLWAALLKTVRTKGALTFKRRIKSHLPFAGIIRSSPYSPRFQDNG